MTHYDGPAFYRKLARLKQRHEQQTKEIIEAQPDDVTVVSPKAQTVKHSATTTKEKKETDNVAAFRNFTKKHTVTYHRANHEKQYYAHLLNQLEKPLESYYLLAASDVSNIYYGEGTKTDQKSQQAATTAPANIVTAAPEPKETIKTSTETMASKSVDAGHTIKSASLLHAPAMLAKQPESITKQLGKVTPTNVTAESATTAPTIESTAREAVAKRHEHQEKDNAAMILSSTDTSQMENMANNLARQAATTTTANKATINDVKFGVEKDHLPEQSATVKHPVTEVGTSNHSDTPTKITASETYHVPPLNLLPDKDVSPAFDADSWAEQQQKTLNETLNAFHVKGNVVRYTIGPTVTQFEVHLERGVKVNKITNLNDDLKLALAAKDIRIEAPIPGRNTVGIEIPNLKSRQVRLSEVLETQQFKSSSSPLTIALGVDLFGKPVIADIAKMPHALIAGSTGSGKSVFINSLLTSLMYKADPDQVKLILIDPKVVELAPYNGLPHLLTPVISDTREASAALEWVVTEMEKRYARFANAGVRNIRQFNEKAIHNQQAGLKMPYIVVIIDELADLMMTASNDVQDSIARITQKARAAGIHLIVATQRPSVDVVTGTIKNNIPTRIAFMVSSQIDSRTILDTGGAERLLGRGDMLYLGNGQNHPIRIQGTYIESEIDQVIAAVKAQREPDYQFKPDDLVKRSMAKSQEDELMPQVFEYLVQEKTISTSKLQRMFSIGYNRAANIIDDLEANNYVGQSQGSKPREVYFSQSDLDKLQAKN
ncbi:DNA translocase FtsK [Agrilactobacillus fermenti]|uniref:DNA translocase FtsK n=1 Tax=Agrilactobacillus fermenti TaxID=2586909 RepID=UPI003A5C46A4